MWFIRTVCILILVIISDGPNYLICGSIEEYMPYEQHCLNIAQQVYVEDMKLEIREYGNIVSLNHVLLNG